VMTVANRSLSGPISIWNDHSDVMTERDVGWISVFAENGQEAADLVPICHRISEDKRVLLPAMLNFDGFILSHVVEPIEMLSKEEIAEFLPVYEPQQRLDVDNPISMGPVGMPEVYTEAKMAHEAQMQAAYEPICEVFEEFSKKFGRTYKPVETYKTNDAEILLVMMGGISETAMAWVDKVRSEGTKVGLVRFRLWRPLPVKDFKEAITGAKVLGVIDRHFSPGGAGGPVAQEIKYMMYKDKNAPDLVEVVAGLGGRDVDSNAFNTVYEKCRKVLDGGEVPPFELIQARGGHYGKV